MVVHLHAPEAVLIAEEALAQADLRIAVVVLPAVLRTAVEDARRVAIQAGAVPVVADDAKNWLI